MIRWPSNWRGWQSAISSIARTRCNFAKTWRARASPDDSFSDGRNRRRTMTIGIWHCHGRAPFSMHMVAGILPLARDIAPLSTEQWKREWEYEDDFCFFLLLHTIVKQPEAFPTPATRPLLERFERALEGGKSTHLDVAKALAARDPHAFSEALGSLLVAEERQIDEDRDSAAVHERDILFWPKSRVSIEGLALLQIGESTGDAHQ